MKLELEIIKKEFNIYPNWRYIMLVWAGLTPLKNVYWLRYIVINFFRKPHFIHYNKFITEGEVKQWRQ